MTDQHQEVFREEALELLTDLEEALLQLEEEPGSEELIARVFRAMHTIKGSGAMFGFDEVAAFTHEVETVFDLVRNGEIPVTRELVSSALAARDHILHLLEENGEPPARSADDLVGVFRRMAAAQERSTGRPAAVEEEERSDEEAAEEVTYRIRLRLPEDICTSGTRPDALLRELNDLGACRVIAHTEALPTLERLDPERCYVYWDILLTSPAGIDALKDVFIFIDDDAEVDIELIDRGTVDEAEEPYARLGEILLQRGDLDRKDLDALLGTIGLFGERVVHSGLVSLESVEAALQEQETVRSLRSSRKKQEAASSVRVPAARLDDLVNMVGELVTVQARLSQAAATREDSELLAIAEEVERLTDELRDTSLNMRMLPIGSTFSKFKRLVRDLSTELGKDIELATSGAETEIDKTVIEKLNDPLVHLMRNSIDHGIEMPAERSERGKPATATITLRAAHSGDSVLITIEDDGRGLDREAILAKARDKGLVGGGAALSDNEVYNLIFAPGFSTAETVTDLSGRGVGMDVVKKAIESLRGSLEVDSEAGRGTRITIRIPLTLAIVESLLVSIDSDTYALPLSAVEECVELTREAVAKAHGRHLLAVRDTLVPYIPLREHFLYQAPPPALQQVVVASVGDSQVGLVVDEVIGQHQSVIKSLGRMYRDSRCVSGATVLGDGSVALILDINQLAGEAEQAA